MEKENKIIQNESKAKNLQAKEGSPGIPIEDWKPHIEKLTKEIESSKRDQVTILGIFASFITFTSVEFQLLKNITSIGDYIALTFLLLASMLLFVFGLKYLIAEDVDKKFYRKPLFIVIFTLVLLSIVFYSIPRFVIFNKAQQDFNMTKGLYINYR
jgi:di/tricarboxylate transporter